MTARFDRLTRQKDFDQLKRHGRTGNGRFVTVRSGVAAPRTRLAIIVSHRVSKKAVIRNRVRRRIRAILTEQPVAALRKAELLIIARPSSGQTSYADLKNDLLKALRHAGSLSAT